MATTTSRPWDGSARRFTEEQWRRSCLLDMADCAAALRDAPAKTRYKLPVREPDGTLNARALGAAAAALAGARTTLKACPAAKAAAARKLVAAYRQARMTPPDSVSRLAG